MAILKIAILKWNELYWNWFQIVNWVHVVFEKHVLKCGIVSLSSENPCLHYNITIFWNTSSSDQESPSGLALPCPGPFRDFQALRPKQQRVLCPGVKEKEHTDRFADTNTHTHTRTHIYIYIYIHTHTCLLGHVVLISPSLLASLSVCFSHK